VNVCGAVQYASEWVAFRDRNRKDNPRGESGTIGRQVRLNTLSHEF